ncbi:MAG TPA: MdtA/MuxA family multidrug efflux RND transporter periplasmic adaptor subunit [Rhizomicrobium sp.]|jgi:multidrug efflux system membrane fusion protein|nr:MdtA/MuxA family multidrug efflux RND transporter periplasmic adaptor subunit [Rhizomicrobium sp.]
MSSRGSEKNRFGEGLDQVRGRVGTYAGHAARWSDTHLPGGQLALWIVLGLVLLGLLIWAVIRPAQPVAHGRGAMGGPLPVGVAQVAKGDVAIKLNALGTVTPLATVTVRPQVSGQIMRFNFQEGQMVKAGDLLAEIDPRTFRAAYDQAVGTLNRDKATLANAQVDLKRDEDLYAVKAVSQQVLATQQALVRSTAATVKSDAAGVESAAINLSYTKITSPVAGRVGLRQVDVGNLVQAGQTNGVVVVTQLQPISVLFSLPEDNISDILGRIHAGATLSVEAYDRGQTVKIASGNLATIDNVIDPTTGTVKLRAMFDNQASELFPNQFVNVRLLVNTLKNQTWVPASAVERGSQGAYVYVVQSDSTVAMRAVTLGPQDGDHVAVVKGLNPGETVVTDGADRLSDGADVVVPKGTKAGAAKPADAAAPTGDARAARRAAMAKACGADIQKFCATEQGFGRMQCLRDHTGDLSGECKAVVSKMHRGGRGGGQ